MKYAVIISGVVVVVIILIKLLTTNQPPQYFSFSEDEQYFLENQGGLVALREQSSGSVMFVSYLPQKVSELIDRPLRIKGRVVANQKPLCFVADSCNNELNALTVEVIEID